MSVPLVVLAVLAVLAGFVFTPFNPWLGSWLTGKTVHEEANIAVMLLSNIAGVAGIGLGWLMYGKKSVPADLVSGPAPGLYRIVHHKYYIDELYQAVIVKPLQAVGSFFQLVRQVDHRRFSAFVDPFHRGAGQSRHPGAERPGPDLWPCYSAGVNRIDARSGRKEVHLGWTDTCFL